MVVLVSWWSPVSISTVMGCIMFLGWNGQGGAGICGQDRDGPLGWEGKLLLAATRSTNRSITDTSSRHHPGMPGRANRVNNAETRLQKLNNSWYREGPRINLAIGLTCTKENRALPDPTILIPRGGHRQWRSG